MYVNIKLKGEVAKTYDCTHLAFRFFQLLIYNGIEIYHFEKSKIEWFTVDKK